MKGLEIARAFFFEWGQPFLEKEFPELARRLAAGRLMGSDVLPLLEELIASSDARARARVVRRICARVHEQLVASGSVTGRGGNPWFLPLLNDYDELRAKSFKHRPLPEPS